MQKAHAICWALSAWIPSSRWRNLLPNVRLLIWIEPFASCLKAMFWIHRCILFMVYSQMFFFAFQVHRLTWHSRGKTWIFSAELYSLPRWFPPKTTEGFEMPRAHLPRILSALHRHAVLIFVSLVSSENLYRCIVVSLWSWSLQSGSSLWECHEGSFTKHSAPGSTVDTSDACRWSKGLDHPFYMIFSTFSGIFEHLWLGLCPVHSKLRVLQHDAWFQGGASETNRLSLLKWLRFNTFGAFHAAIEATERVGMSPKKRPSAMAVSRFMDRSGHSIAHRIRHLAVFVRLAWFHIGKIRKFRLYFRMQICLSFCRQKFETTPSSSTCLQAGACFLKEK